MFLALQRPAYAPALLYELQIPVCYSFKKVVIKPVTQAPKLPLSRRQEALFIFELVKFHDYWPVILGRNLLKHSVLSRFEEPSIMPKLSAQNWINFPSDGPMFWLGYQGSHEITNFTFEVDFRCLRTV